jgi:hypothetical protein
MPHAFVSYVRDNQEQVDRLARDLRSGGAQLWLDREQIQPGQRWQQAIRRAIESGSFFIACFSEEYASRATSYMNEELTLAIDVLRKRPTDRAWFIPVVFSGDSVPDRDIGAGETLRDLQWVDLSHEWDDGIRRILDVIKPDKSREGRSASEPADLLDTEPEYQSDNSTIDAADPNGEQRFASHGKMSIASNWAGICRRSQSHATTMGHGRPPLAVELINQETKEFCEQPCPQTEAELSLRWRQSDALNSKIRTICHADTMGRGRPAIAAQLVEEARKCCGLPTSDADFKALDRQINEIMSSIRNLCFDDLTRRNIQRLS